MFERIRTNPTSEPKLRRRGPTSVVPRRRGMLRWNIGRIAGTDALGREGDGVTGNEGRTRNRAETEAQLLAATRRRLYQDGVLAGLNLQTVAAEAGVNRGLIYQYFGSRQGLLRAALKDMSDIPQELASGPNKAAPFVDRRTFVLRASFDHMPYLRLQALLALDEFEELEPMTDLELNRELLKRDVAEGALPDGSDPLALHVLTVSVMHGYAVFGRYYARQLGISLDELNERLADVFRNLLDSMGKARAE